MGGRSVYALSFASLAHSTPGQVVGDAAVRQNCCAVTENAAAQGIAAIAFSAITLAAVGAIQAVCTLIALGAEEYLADFLHQTPAIVALLAVLTLDSGPASGSIAPGAAAANCLVAGYCAGVKAKRPFIVDGSA